MSQIGLQVAARFHLPVNCAERILPIEGWPPAPVRDTLPDGPEHDGARTVATALFRLFLLPVHLERRWFELLSANTDDLPRSEDLDGYATELAAFLCFKGLRGATTQENLALTVSVTAAAPEPSSMATPGTGPVTRDAWGIVNLGTDPAALRAGLDAGGPQPGDRAIVLHPREGIAFPDHQPLLIDGLWPLSDAPAVSIWLSGW